MGSWFSKLAFTVANSVALVASYTAWNYFNYGVSAPIQPIELAVLLAVQAVALPLIAKATGKFKP